MTRIIPIDVSLAMIQSLDLTNVKRKMNRPKPHGNGWDYEMCDLAEIWYKRFLTLIVKYPMQSIVPNVVIDEMWHSHITDTRAYIPDCLKIFGKYLHHNPYYGMNGDAPDRDKAFEVTNQLYIKKFGEDCIKVDPHAVECAQDCQWVDQASDSAIAQLFEQAIEHDPLGALV